MATVTRPTKSAETFRVLEVNVEAPPAPRATQVEAVEPQQGPDDYVGDRLALWITILGMLVMCGHLLLQTFGLPGYWALLR